jgi:alpha-maltose-1-phosphate synthase
MTMGVTPAIYFHPDAVEGTGKDLVGRRSAGQSFLKGFLRHCPGPVIKAVTDGPNGAKAFREAAAELGETRPIEVGMLCDGSDFTGPGTVFFPAPGYRNAAWLRQRFGNTSCSLVGITHTVSTRRVIEGFHNLMIEPVEDWDAIICTSHAVKSVVARQFDLEVEFIRQRFGATRVPLPQLPVIPLGIETADFTPLPGARERMRAAQQTPDNAVVVMTMGRLSVVEKANPLPLFLALEDVAQRAGKPVHLWMVGWASRPEEEELHRNGAAKLCPSVNARIIDGRDADIRRNIWAGADIFTLPADSIQETFGLVPVEAMAAGLPAVMPDWDGFRDTVAHGVSGLLIPTRMAPTGAGEQIARRFADGRDAYLNYLTLVQSHIQIDVRHYAQAIAALVADEGLRKRLGTGAMRHARTHFDWQAVIPQYLALADDLGQRRNGAIATTPALPSGPISPLEVDPFDLYCKYPTGAVGGQTIVTLRLMPTADLLALHDQISGRQLYRRAAFPAELALRAAALLAQTGPQTLAGLAENLRATGAQTVAMVLALAKSDIFTLTDPV